MTARKKTAKKAAKKTAKKTGRKKRPPTPGTTAVKDRVVGIPLGHEAQMLAEFLRGCGADPKLVPDLRDDVARTEWRNARQDATRVPTWYLDWAAAILEQIPQRSLRKPGKPKQDAGKSVEVWTHGMSVAEAARMVATLEARKRDEDVSEDDIKKRADDLARQIYRRRKTDMP
jgi:hypothetical protein